MGPVEGMSAGCRGWVQNHNQHSIRPARLHTGSAAAEGATAPGSDFAGRAENQRPSRQGPAHPLVG